MVSIQRLAQMSIDSSDFHVVVFWGGIKKPQVRVGITCGIFYYCFFLGGSSGVLNL
jgi:hypothetical protein